MDKLSFELGCAAKHGQHQPAVRRGSVCPSVFQAAEASFPLADDGQHIEQVTCRACQLVEPCLDQHIARLEPSNQLGRSCLAPKSYPGFTPSSSATRKNLPRHPEGVMMHTQLGLGPHRRAMSY